MPEYSVLIKAEVNVRLPGIQAGSQKEAIEKVQAAVDLHRVFDWANLKAVAPMVQYVEYGDYNTGYLVDEAGDEDYENSGWYGPDMEPIMGDLADESSSSVFISKR